jgi:hypothetical protein
MTPEGRTSVVTENRLSFEQLSALAPGEQVVIEVSGDFRRPRRCAGTVVRVEGSRLVVTTKGARGGTYIEHYSRRDGVWGRAVSRSSSTMSRTRPPRAKSSAC